MGSSNGVISSMQKGNTKELSVKEFGKMLDLIEKTERVIYKKIEKHLK